MEDSWAAVLLTVIDNDSQIESTTQHTERQTDTSGQCMHERNMLRHIVSKCTSVHVAYVLAAGDTV